MDELDRIETPENVELERALAGIGSRFIAGLVDNLLIAGFFAILLIVLMLVAQVSLPFGPSGVEGLGVWTLAFLILAIFAIYWGYFVFFELVTNGQSPGKKTVKIRVVKEGGGAITFTDIAVRNLLRAVDGLAVYGVAGICMFATKKGQRLGDLAAGTVVVSEQIRDYSSRTDKQTKKQWELAIGPQALRVSGLTPEEFRILHNYWVRREELSLEARARILPGLLTPILQRTGQTPADQSVETLEEHLAQLLGSAAAAEQRERQGTGRLRSEP